MKEEQIHIFFHPVFSPQLAKLSKYSPMPSRRPAPGCGDRVFRGLPITKIMKQKLSPSPKPRPSLPILGVNLWGSFGSNRAGLKLSLLLLHPPFPGESS